jgi:hypothetical protein
MSSIKYQVRNSEYHLTPGELARLIQGARAERDRLIVQVFEYTGIRYLTYS